MMKTETTEDNSPLLYTLLRKTRVNGTKLLTEIYSRVI